MPEILKIFEKDPNGQLDFTLHFGAPDWLAATDYDEFTLVYDPLDGNLYEARFSHTSGATNRAADGSSWKHIKNEKLWLKKYAGATADEEVASSIWTLASGITSVQQTIDPAGYNVTIFISGGTEGTSYVVTCQITTDNSPVRIAERSFQIDIIDK